MNFWQRDPLNSLSTRQDTKTHHFTPFHYFHLSLPRLGRFFSGVLLKGCFLLTSKEGSGPPWGLFPEKKIRRDYFWTKTCGLGDIFVMYVVRSRSFLRPACHGCHCRISKRYPRQSGFGQGFLGISWMAAARLLRFLGDFCFPDAQWDWPIYLQNWVVFGVNVGKYAIH